MVVTQNQIDHDASPLLSLPSLIQSNRLPILDYVFRSVIGHQHFIEGPYGDVPLIYMDYVASGRSLEFIEDFIIRAILPQLGDPTKPSSFCQIRTQHLMNQAKQIIRNSVNASEDYEVFQIGSGSTGAFYLLTQVLDQQFKSGKYQNHFIKVSDQNYECKLSGKQFESEAEYCAFQKTDEYLQLLNSQQVYQNQQPIVFISVFEHHSNMLMWKEIGAQVVYIPFTLQGLFDYEKLEEECEKYKENPRLIGSFSAGSNVTGVLTDVKRITRIMKQFGGIVIFDYAASAPYVNINMKPQEGLEIDAICISTHKFVGGPETPGLLIFKQSLFSNATPIFQSKQSLLYMTDQEYLNIPSALKDNLVTDAIGMIRAGLVFQLKQAIDPTFIEQKELYLSEKIASRLSKHPNISILGPQTVAKCPIFSMVFWYKNRYMHHHLISTLLNDFFGIQSRSGCACAGPYSIDLFQMDFDQVEKFASIRVAAYEQFVPGFVRLNFNYFISDEVIEYCLKAIEFIADNAIYLAPLYESIMHGTEYSHRSFKTNGLRHTTMKRISDISYQSGQMIYPNYDKYFLHNLNIFFNRAERVVQKIKSEGYVNFDIFVDTSDLKQDLEPFRWYIHQSEAAQIVQGKQIKKIEETNPPFEPMKFRTLNRSQTLKRIESLNEIYFQRLTINVKVPSELKLKVKAAIKELNLLKNSKKVLIAASGGPVSMATAVILTQLSKQCLTGFQVGVCTIDPMVAEYNPKPLNDYLAQLEIAHQLISKPIADIGSKNRSKAEFQKFCRRVRRQLLYKTAEFYGYDTLVLCHTLDDIIEQFMYNTLCKGKIAVAKSNYIFKNTGIRVIKPMVYCTTKELNDFCQQCNLPIIPFNIPYCFKKSRHLEMISLGIDRFVGQDQKIYQNILNSIGPLLRYDISDINSKDLDKYTDSDQSNDEVDEFIDEHTLNISKTSSKNLSFQSKPKENKRTSSCCSIF